MDSCRGRLLIISNTFWLVRGFSERDLEVNDFLWEGKTFIGTESKQRSARCCWSCAYIFEHGRKYDKVWSVLNLYCTCNIVEFPLETPLRASLGCTFTCGTRPIKYEEGGSAVQKSKEMESDESGGLVLRWKVVVVEISIAPMTPAVSLDATIKIMPNGMQSIFNEPDRCENEGFV